MFILLTERDPLYTHTHSLDMNSPNDVYSGKYESSPLEAGTAVYPPPISPSPVNYGCIK